MTFFLGLTFFCFFVCSLRCSHAVVSNDVTSQNNYTVKSGDVTCVVMTAKIQLQIPYVGKHSNLTSTVRVPPSAFATGVCQPKLGVDTLSVYFNGGWQLSITFSNASSSSSAPPSYRWQKVSLTYKMEAQYFPNVSAAFENQSLVQDTIFPNGTMLTQIGQTYSCAETLLPLSGNVSMNISSLKYWALGNDNSTSLVTSGETLCDKPDTIPDTDVALAVSLGIALGVSIVSVVFLYVLVSRVMDRNKGFELG